MSYDSLGHNSDSLPQTPRSLPAGGPRDSLDSAALEEPLLQQHHQQHMQQQQQHMQQQQALQQQSWGTCGAGASQGAEAPGPATPAQLWGSGPELAPLPAVPESCPAPALPPACEHAAARARLHHSLSSGGGGSSGAPPYPCIEDVGSGWAAVGPLCWHVVLPLAVLVAGVLASLSALLLAVAAMRARS